MASELAASYPHLVRMVIAHEPPAYRLLEGADQEEALRSHAALLETFRQEGVPAAMKLMFARSGVDLSDREPDVPAPVLPAPGSEVAARRFADLAHFLTWDAPAVSRFQPDIAGMEGCGVQDRAGQSEKALLPPSPAAALSPLSAMLGGANWYASREGTPATFCARKDPRKKSANCFSRRTGEAERPAFSSLRCGLLIFDFPPFRIAGREPQVQTTARLAFQAGLA